MITLMFSGLNQSKELSDLLALGSAFFETVPILDKHIILWNSFYFKELLSFQRSENYFVIGYSKKRVKSAINILKKNKFNPTLIKEDKIYEVYLTDEDLFKLKLLGIQTQSVIFK